MNDILKIKKKRIKKLTEEINQMGLEIGMDDGSGTFEVLDRLCDGTATELETKRANKNSLKQEVELMKLLHERSVLIREVEKIKKIRCQ